MGKTSSKSKNAWMARNYDRVSLLLPKGRKEEIKAIVAPQSLNSFICEAIEEKLNKRAAGG